MADYRSATMTVSFETDDATYAKLMSDAQGDAEISFDNGLAGAARRYLHFALHNAYITDYTDEVSETGLVSATMTLKGEGDGTKHGCQITAYNTAATTSADSS